MADNLQVTDDPAGSGLSYSALENEGESVEHRPASRRSTRPRYGPRGGSSNSGTSGGFTRCLRASVPHAILLIIYIAFLLIGGGCYFLLERNTNEAVQEAEEESHVAEYFILKNQIRTAFKNITKTYGLSSMANLTGLVEEFAMMVEMPYLMYLGDIRHQELSYTRSVVFCATTISTIGYGDAVPNTTGGKVMVVIFSLVGIPLTLVVLADIGYLLAGGVIYLVDKIRYQRAKRAAAAAAYSGGTSEGLAPAIVAVMILLLFVLLGSCAVALMEGWYYGDSLYFSFVTLSTIGFGNIVPLSHYDHVLSFFAILVYILLGLSIMSMCLVLLLPKGVAMVSRLADKFEF